MVCRKQAHENPERHTEQKMGNEVITQALIKQFAWFLVYLIWIIADVEGIWDRSHFYGILVAVLGTIALCFAELKPKSASIFSVLFTIIACAIYLLSGPILPPETEIHGWLLPANDPTPTNQCSDGIAKGMIKADPLLLVGGMAFAVPGKTKFTAVKVGTCPVISLTFDNEGLKIDVDDYDSDGNLVFVIRGNEFHVMPKHTSYSERSLDRSTITIHDEKGGELLMVRFINRGTVAIRGTFGCAGHDLVTFSDHDITDSQGSLGRINDTCTSGWFSEAALGVR